MKERPILFSAPMVRAILEGRKTQTRRLVNPQPVSNGYAFDAATSEIRCYCDYLPPDCLVQPPYYDHPFLDQPELSCPYGEPGDRLWVRESFRLRADQDEKPPSQDWWKSGAWHEASGGPHLPSGCAGGPGKLRPSIHMPRWASRITLRVTSVRVERLQAISGYDVVAEGVRAERCPCERCGQTSEMCPGTELDHVCAFAKLWESINGARAAWHTNPWVWVVGFERVESET